MTDQLRPFYDAARALYPILPAWYEETDHCINPEFDGLNAAGMPIFCVPPGYTLAPDEGAHEAGHAYLALLERAKPSYDYLSLYWFKRGFPGTWQNMLIGSQAKTGTEAWMMDPRESWAEAFARSCVPTHNEKTMTYGKDMDPLALRAWFQSLNPASLPPVQKEPALRLMYDSTNANDIPVDAVMVAGYIDGLYEWSADDWSRFPNAVKVRIAIRGWNDADVLDVEWGAASVADVPAWVERQRARGAVPSVYVNHSNWQACKDACAGAGVSEPYWWLASYDNVAEIPAGTIAKQYANEPLAGGHYDLSVVADYWPGIDGGDVVSKEEFEAYKVALEQQLIAQYAGIAHTHAPTGTAVAAHSHDTPAGKTSGPKQP